MHNMLMKMPNMGNSFVYFRHSLVPGVKWWPLTDTDRPSEPARLHDTLDFHGKMVASTCAYLIDGAGVPADTALIYGCGFI